MLLSQSLNGFWGFNGTMILVLIGLVLSLGAAALVKSTFAKYAKIRSASGLTGAQAAERVLRGAGIYDVSIAHIAGSLTDHYDPRSKTLRLSDDTFASASVAAIGVAAHECGHAIQDQERYVPLVLRSTLVPAANIGANLAWPIFIIGLVVSSLEFLTVVGIALFSMAVLFQLVTLPVEINASRRAVKILESTGIMGDTEKRYVKKVLTAAAMTYLASLAASVLQLLRLVILAGGRRRD